MDEGEKVLLNETRKELFQNDIVEELELGCFQTFLNANF